MADNVHDGIAGEELACEFYKLRILHRSVRQVIPPLQLDTNGEVVAAGFSSPLGDARVPSPL